MSGRLIFLLMVMVTVASAFAEEQVPKKAICTTCAVRGATHGKEDVVAWRDYEGSRYFFCAKDCAKAFDTFPTAYIEHPLPRPAPNATVEMLSGEALELSSLKGNVVLVDFWATWCKPCRRSMPMLNKLHERGVERLKVVGISIDEKAKDVVPKFVKKRKLKYPIALDTNPRPAWYAYHVAAIPAMFLIDSGGQIVREWRGEVDADEVVAAIDKLLAAKPNVN